MQLVADLIKLVSELFSLVLIELRDAPGCRVGLKADPARTSRHVAGPQRLDAAGTYFKLDAGKTVTCIDYPAQTVEIALNTTTLQVIFAFPSLKADYQRSAVSNGALGISK